MQGQYRLNAHGVVVSAAWVCCRLRLSCNEFRISISIGYGSCENSSDESEEDDDLESHIGYGSSGRKCVSKKKLRVCLRQELSGEELVVFGEELVLV